MILNVCNFVMSTTFKIWSRLIYFVVVLFSSSVIMLLIRPTIKQLFLIVSLTKVHLHSLSLSSASSSFRRLYPDLSFFQVASNYPCRELVGAVSGFENLRRRVEHSVLKSQNVGRNRLGITIADVSWRLYSLLIYSTCVIDWPVESDIETCIEKLIPVIGNVSFSLGKCAYSPSVRLYLSLCLYICISLLMSVFLSVCISVPLSFTW